MSSPGEGNRKARWLPWLCLATMVTLYVSFFGLLSVTRHEAFETNALDLGYTGQALWNTAQGRPFEFSTYEGALYQLDIPLEELRRRDILLSYHVEPLLLLIAPLLRVVPDLRSVLLLQTLGLALGAVPAYLLARRRLRHPWLALVFPALYLIAPSVAATNLSDFHAVAFSPVFLLSAYVALDSDHWKTFGLFCFLALLCKEDIALLVAMLGLYAALFRKPRWVGSAVAVLSVAWFVLATQIITPGFNGLGHSPFLIRYNQFGTSAVEVLRSVVSWPSPVLEWFLQPAVLRYGLLLVGTGGGIVLLGPQGWVLAMPVIAANSLSNYHWMHSGGGHYTASIVAFLIIGAIEGTSWLDRRLHRRWLTAVVVLLALGFGLTTHWWAGVSPLSRTWNPPVVTGHDLILSEALADIPDEASVIAQSGVYPHVALRRYAHLFPTETEADVIVLDVTSTTYPWSMNKYRSAVGKITSEPGLRVETARDGIIILDRGLGRGTELDATEFTSFARDPGGPQVEKPIEFESGLALDGISIQRPMAVTTGQLPWQITTFWHVTRPQTEAYRPVLFFRREDGALSWAYDEGTPTDIWFRTDRWTTGSQVKVVFPPLDLSDFAGVLVGVLIPSGDTWSVADRLQIIENDAVEPLDQGTLALLFDLP